jgi:hypothetical protein
VVNWYIFPVKKNLATLPQETRPTDLGALMKQISQSKVAGGAAVAEARSFDRTLAPLVEAAAIEEHEAAPFL